MYIEMIIDGITPTLNSLYVGTHWAKRKTIARNWHRKVTTACKKYKIDPIENFPICIITQTRFKINRGRDVSNCFVANKLIEDGLVKAGILPDDTPEYVDRHIVLKPIKKFGKSETLVILTDMKGDDLEEKFKPYLINNIL